MYTSVITNAEKVTLQEDGSVFLDVQFDIKEGDEVVDMKRLAFAIDTSSEEVLAEIERYTANYSAEIELAAIRAEADAELTAADATIGELIGQEINIA